DLLVLTFGVALQRHATKDRPPFGHEHPTWSGTGELPGAPGGRAGWSARAEGTRAGAARRRRPYPMPERPTMNSGVSTPDGVPQDQLVSATDRRIAAATRRARAVQPAWGRT